MPFVSLSAGDTAFDLVALIEKVTAAPSEEGKKGPLVQLVEEKKYSQLFEDGVFGKNDEIMAIILEKASETEVDNFFSLCFSLLHELNATDVGSMISRLATSLSARTGSYPKRKLQLLCTLFNILKPQSPLRATISAQLLSLAIQSQLADAVVSEFSRIDQWMSEWPMTDEEKAELLLLMSQAHKQTNSPLPSQICLLRYLKTFNSADSKRLAEAAEHACTAVLYALKDAQTHQCDPMLELAAVKQLGNKDAPQKHQDLFALLRIFALEGAAEYQKFISERKDALSSLGLDGDAALAKIRRVTLISLSINVTSLAYRDVAAALKLETDDEVEESVIDAVAHDCMDAKLDQEHSVVVVRRVDPRSFNGEADSWNTLNEQLGLWAKNLDDVIANLPHRVYADADDMDN